MEYACSSARSLAGSSTPPNRAYLWNSSSFIEHNNLTNVGPSNGGPSNYEPYKTDQEREGVQPDAVSFSRLSEQETMHLQKPSLTPPPTLMTEEDYRSYGLRGERNNNLTPDGPSTSLSFCMILCSNSKKF
ncbi:hypothetical protein Tco_0085279 [Tanacetum coccineum]